MKGAYMSRKLISILSIAGSDCAGGAGIQADIRAAAMRNVFASTAVTAVTVQNSQGLKALNPISPEALLAQIQCIFEDCRPNAIKIGMLGSIENGRTVVSFLRDYAKEIPIVVDPVMSATAGGHLSLNPSEIHDFYVHELCPLATVVTPNLQEVEKFGCRKDNIGSTAECLLDKLGCKAVVIKGGHSQDAIITDTLAMPGLPGSIIMHMVSSSRISCHNLHGTGCVYSSLLASEIAKGKDISEAFKITSWQMKAIISQSCDYKLGNADYGPLNLFDYQTILP